LGSVSHPKPYRTSVTLRSFAQNLGSKVLRERAASRLFEGLSILEVNAEMLEIGFTFSINAEHMEKIEALIGRRELTDHRMTFVMFVFATIDLEYPLGASLPDGFRQTLEMSDYIL
jgi:hypothetical protein